MATESPQRLAALHENNEIPNTVADQQVMMNVAELASMLANALKDARLDPLTDLPLRDRFDRRIHTRLGRLQQSDPEGNPRSFAVIILDIDHFKSVNDTHGHNSGDVALQLVSIMLQNSLRTLGDGNDDLVVRYGGEEFAIIADGIDSDEKMQEVMERIHNLSFDCGPPVGVITASIGGMICTKQSIGNNPSVESIVGIADKNLYLAKEDPGGGRNGWSFVSCTDSTIRIKRHADGEVQREKIVIA